MDKATLTLGDGKTTSFSNSIIFLTSNLGAKEMDSCLTQIGFSPHQRPDHGTEYNNRTRKIGVGAARKRFSPEFFNRLDHVIVFRPLSEKELILILELELQALQEQLRAGKSPILVDLSQDAKIHLVGLADTRYGARDLKRIIQKEITMPLSRLLTTNQARGGDIILVSLSENSKLIFHKQSFLSMPAGR
jgi:ATP-dependent Clp protease ATP-binding subunit ClpA